MLADAGTGKRFRLFPSEPELHSGNRAWASVRVEQHRVEAWTLPPARPANYLFAVHLEAPVEWEIEDGDGYRACSARTGQISFFPAGSVFALRARRGGRLLVVSLRPRLVLGRALTTATDGSPRFVPQRGIDDPFARTLCEGIRGQVESTDPRAGDYVEAMAQALAAHALRFYSASGSDDGPEESAGGLTGHQLRRAVECIRGRLAEDLAMSEVAAAAGLSPFHFAREFRRSTGMSPHQYLLRARLERARELLEATTGRIGDIAVQTGFCDPSHLSAHFRRWLGVSPRTFRDRMRG